MKNRTTDKYGIPELSESSVALEDILWILWYLSKLLHEEGICAVIDAVKLRSADRHVDETTIRDKITRSLGITGASALDDFVDMVEDFFNGGNLLEEQIVRNFPNANQTHIGEELEKILNHART